jgi:peptidoglycan/xylan/chitin deacetylase (PgdA/CDA1 family)
MIPATLRRIARSAVLDVLGRVHPPPGPGVRFLYGHTVAPADVAALRATLRMLRGYFEFVTLPDAVRLLGEGRRDGRYLCFSFDDGFRDNYELIAPTLDEFGARACFFVPSNLISGDAATRAWILRENLHTSETRPVMTWEMLRELDAAGFTIGCHTADHANLATLPHDTAVEQVLESKRAVEARLGKPCRYFAWPYGREWHFPAPLAPALAPSFDAIFSAIRSRASLSYGGLVINRDHFEPAWPTEHVRFFLSRRVVAGPAPRPGAPSAA